MDIPKTCRMGGHTISVGFDKKLIDRNKMGEAHSNTNDIWLNPNVCRTNMEETYIHELVEIACGMCELEIKHQDIQTLACLLHQALTSFDGVIASRD